MQKRGQAVKEAMIEVASRAFREKGYRAASVDWIAREAGVSKATVYAHFSNKEGLFKATVREFVGPILKLVPKAEPVQDVRAELLAFGEKIHKVLLAPEKAEWDRMMVAISKQFPSLAQDYFNAGPARALSQLADFLRVQSESGRLKVTDPEFSADMLCGMLFGTKILRNLILNGCKPFNREQLEKTVDAFLKVHSYEMA